LLSRFLYKLEGGVEGKSDVDVVLEDESMDVSIVVIITSANIVKPINDFFIFTFINMESAFNIEVKF